MASYTSDSPPRIPPLSIPQIRELFIHPVKLEQKKWMEPIWKANIKAQLWYYDIEFRSDARISTLEKTLREAEKAGKLLTGRPRILQYKRERPDLKKERLDLKKERPNSKKKRPGSKRESIKAQEENEETETDLWKQAMEEHRALVRAPRPTAPKGRYRYGILEKCRGSYIVRCRKITEEWPVSSVFTMDITGLNPCLDQAAVDFGVIEGTMLLAQSKDVLSRHAGVVNNDSETEDENQDGDEDESGDEDEDEDEGYGPSKSEKRKAPATEPRGGRGRSKKQPKLSVGTESRLYFGLKGRETGDGQIFFKAEKGHLDFDHRFTSFTGIASLPIIRGAFKIEGFKIDDTAKMRAEPWSNFSEKAWESECVSRWH
ncbi:hypothetical protein K504DRAFT_467366 [Pleomassaria siparia CBS 279.74]|uniref:Uncharacterized protein n=1 Tax=Pleomassaria siparia CBS 279.74 TaxID=1314801 RepID=A0A6G1K9V4_9PLEO|nr:hypothetical protein K504DRAFT_467366 [Pleomassaria siparia CBS 279.74]